MDDRQKIVALRHKDKSKEDFYKYLRYLTWTDEEIDEMWNYAQKKRGEEE